jgi:hypothetical protein
MCRKTITINLIEAIREAKDFQQAVKKAWKYINGEWG